MRSHCTANYFQHVRSSGQAAMVCKSRATLRALITCKIFFKLEQPIPESTWYSRSTESVRMMACVTMEVSHCIACVTASASMVRLEVGTLATTVFENSPSTLFDCKPPTRAVPCVDHNVMWFAVGFDEHCTCAWLFQLALHGKACLSSRTEESLSRALTHWAFSPVPLLLEVCEAAHMLDLLFCWAHP